MVNVREEEDKKNEKEAANYTAQITVATNPTLQEDNTDRNKEAAANDTDPIAVTADCALQEDEDKEWEENKTTWKDELPTLA
eukprot:jgi/Psemu1/8402/gm1.8402_g